MINNSHHSSSILYFQFLVSEFCFLIIRFCTSHILILDSGFWILDAVPFVLIWMNSRFDRCPVLDSKFHFSPILSCRFFRIIHSVLWILDCGFWMAWFFQYNFWILDYGFWLLDSGPTLSGLWILLYLYSFVWIPDSVHVDCWFWIPLLSNSCLQLFLDSTLWLMDSGVWILDLTFSIIHHHASLRVECI